MGRQDHQVKLRGFRIELGEIERRLREHADVREAAAVVRELGAGKQLVAYIVARHGNAPEPETMKRFLAERLPAHMVPAHVVALDAFARTPNGKLDLNAMPGPDSLRRHERIAPRNPTEATLAAIVAEVLRVPGLGVLDNFFEVGGDSILSLQVVARARERGIALSAKQVFEAQTVAAMALVATPISAPGEAVEPAGRFAASGLSEDELRSLMSEMASDAEQ
jgi:aryl carrier-like protein